MAEKITQEPRARRLTMPAGYQVAAEGEPLLPWSHVVARLEPALNYWLATTWPETGPPGRHSRRNHDKGGVRPVRQTRTS